MQSQNLKVTTYTCFFRQCNSKIKPLGGWQDHSTLKLSFRTKKESGGVFGVLSYARGLAHGAALGRHVAYSLH